MFFVDNDQWRHKHSPVPRPTFSLPPESSSKTCWATVHGSTATKSRGYTGTASASALASTWRFICYTRCIPHFHCYCLTGKFSLIPNSCFYAYLVTFNLVYQLMCMILCSISWFFRNTKLFFFTLG